MLETTDANTGENKRLLLPGAIRLSEIIAAMSVALDLTEGQPPGHAAKSCLIGMRLARELDIPKTDLVDLYYALLLKDLGCSSTAAKMCMLFGADDRGLKRDIKTIDWTKSTQTAKYTLQNLAPTASPFQKAMHLAAIAREGKKGAKQLVTTRCERGADISRLLNFSEDVAQAIRHLDEHWNGNGHPFGLKGEEIPLLSRIMGIAQTVEVFFSKNGLKTATEIAQARCGTWFDPELSRVFEVIAKDQSFWSTLSQNTSEELLRCLPEEEATYTTEDDLDRIALGFARVVDAKSPWTYRHSEGVAEIAVGIAESLGMNQHQKRDLKRAGLLHDIGKLGVSNMILDKPGKPNDAEYAEIRKHPDYSKQILDGIDLFKNLSDVAAAHHERLDGNGYHRRMPGEELRIESRLLAVADVCEALTAKRPYRDALPQEQVSKIMQKELGTGLCHDCYDGLQQWWDRTTFTARVEQQLEAIEKLHE